MVVGLVLAGACYAPAPPSGAPCAAGGACPSGLICIEDRCLAGPAPDAPGAIVDAPDDPPIDPDGGIDAPPDAPAAQVIVFAQQAAGVSQTATASQSAALPASQAAHGTNVVFVGWLALGTSITSVTDTRGNAYALVVPSPGSATYGLALYVAKDIAAGANTVTVAFSAQTVYTEVRVVEYRGVSASQPIDVMHQGTGTSATSSSGAMTIAGAVVVAGNSALPGTTTTGPGAGFTSRQVTSSGHIIEDRTLATPGAVAPSAPLDISNSWIMSAVALRPGP